MRRCRARRADPPKRDPDANGARHREAEDQVRRTRVRYEEHRVGCRQADSIDDENGTIERGLDTTFRVSEHERDEKDGIGVGKEDGQLR